MTISIISVLDKPSSLPPFFVKDAFDITGRTYMANNEGGKHEAREKFIEEFGTSVFWIFGIPAVRKLSEVINKKTLDTQIHFKRINTEGPQGYSAKNIEGVELGGKLLANIKKDLAGNGIDKYRRYHKATTVAAVGINLFMLMVALPKFNQFLSRKIIKKEAENQKKTPVQNYVDGISFNSKKTPTFTQFLNKSKNEKTSFGSLKPIKNFFTKKLFNFTDMAENAQLNVTSSMLLLDWGISGSRVTFIPRDNNERIEYAVKEGGIILFFYYAAGWIKKGLSAISKKAFKTPIDLDYKVIKDDTFAKEMKNAHKNPNLFEFAKGETNELNIIKFIDAELAKTKGNPNKTDKNNVFENFTLKMAQKEGLIHVEYDESLGKWIRNSKKYIKTDEVADLSKNLKAFHENAMKSGLSMDKMLKRTKGVKGASVFANMAICCASLSFILPSIQYKIREHRTKTNRAPGIKLYQDLAAENKLEV